jgi:hypothetical protein
MNKLCMFVSVVCDKCSSLVYKMKALRSVKEVLSQSSNRCMKCGASLSLGEFLIRATKT